MRIFLRQLSRCRCVERRSTNQHCFRLDESDVKRRELGVAFRDLRVVGVGAAASYQSTFGSAINPLNAIRGLRDALRPATRDILSGFEGVVRPGEMLRECSVTVHVTRFVGVLCVASYHSFDLPHPVERRWLAARIRCGLRGFPNPGPSAP